MACYKGPVAFEKTFRMHIEKELRDGLNIESCEIPIKHEID